MKHVKTLLGAILTFHDSFKNHREKPNNKLNQFPLPPHHSKMDQTLAMFRSAVTTHLNKLDVIQNQALRHILGAIKTTPIVAMEAEALNISVFFP